MQTKAVAPYPGYDVSGKYTEPAPAPRVRPEAQEYEMKNRGSLELFGSGEPKHRIVTPQPNPRCSYEGRGNYELGRNGTVSGLLHGQATPRPDPAPGPRMRPEGQGIASGHSGKSTSVLFKNYGNLPMSARQVPRVKPEAEEVATTHKGGRMDNLLHDPVKIPLSARAVPRIKPEAADIANKEGKKMGKIIHSYAQGPLSNRTEPRVKPEGEENAELDRGKRMGAMLHEYGHQPLSARPAPRVKSEAMETANLDKGGRMSRLMHEGDRLPSDPRPIPRTTTAAAKSISRAHRGQIGRLFSEQGKRTQMSAYPTQENRPLKKPKLGPPDVYPQDPKQKEDELTAASVKHGFNNNPTFGDEYGSARRENIKQDKFGSEFIAIMAKKREFNTFQDTSKKKQQPTKDNFWPAAKNKNAMEAWFKDLAGNKPLSQLAKKVPTFNKKEEIFSTLCEFSVPMVKAAWFIKMTASYNVAMQENKTKKRQTILKIQEPYSGGPGGPTSGFLTVSSSNPTLQVDLDQALKQWHYSCKLARHMYDEGLLDRQEYLNWLIDLLEKMKHMEDTTLKLIMAQVLDFCSDCGYVSPRTQSPMLASNGNGMTSAAENNQMMSQNPLTAIFEQYNRCPQHRGIILSLSATLQVITLLCPTGLVWNSLGDGKSTSFLFGSPLDLLPCAPSNLPMPLGPHNDQIRAQIRASEHQLKLRGRAAEVRWSSDKCQQSTRGFTISKMLDVLDMLDRHNFDKVESNNSIDTLYSKIFSINQNKDGNEPLVSDEPIIHLLIDWAVSMYRCGNYRAVVVAKLLEKRQNELRNEKFGDTDVSEDKDSVGSDMMVSPGVPIFQNLLLHFLDERAPVLDENLPEDNRQGFANLIQLFSELIRHDVFSHDAYMCTLISRGDLMSSPAVMSLSADSIDLYSVKSQDESIKHEHQDDIKVDIDMHTMESDLTSLFASVKSVKSEKDVPVPSVSGMAEQNISQQNKGPSRHMLFAQHFPIPQDDISVHECNQRMIVLYGVGKARDDARHISKKITKDTLKLFSKKNCIDTSSGDLGKMKKKKEKDSGDSSMSSTNTNFELVFDGIFNKFQKLSFYDQHAVTAQCASTVLEQIHSFTSNSSSYLPLVENISYLFDLMEYSYNIYGLLEFSVQLLKELSLVEQQLNSQDSSLAGRYTTSLCLCIVGVFRKYHSYLLVCPDLTVQAFEGLIGVVKHVCNPADCSSAERCILAYLYDAYTSCSYLRSKFSEMFSNAYTKMKMTLYATITPSASNLLSQLDNVLIKQLNDNPANRYSFVCNAMLNICNSQETDRLNEISVLCAELTARCNSLSSEWLGVLQALCCSSNHSCGFIDVLTQIDVSDMSIHDSLAVFTAILIARHCFSLQDLVVHVVLPSLLAARPTASGDTDAEPGARLTCHILLRLFKTSDMSLMSAQNGKSTCNIKASCDRHLLAAAHDSITVGPVLAVLKAMLVLKDDEDMDMMLDTSKGKGGIESAGLSEFAKHALKEMCRQEWVQEKFLKDPDGVLSSDLLLDPMLTNKQMICYPNGVPNQVEGCDPDNKQVIYRVLQTLNQWGLRVSLLELQLMFKQATSQTETNSILDNIARGAIELFQQQTDGGRSNNDMDSQQGGRNDSDGDAIWMIGPLISKLPSQVQGRVLKLAGSKLEGGNNFLSSKGGKFDKDRGKRSKSLLSQQPFLSLVLNCLKGQDEQREGLLSSLLSQLEKFINNCKEALDKTPDESKVRQNIHEALLLRLSLVGGMFDTIQRNTSNTIDWALLLVQLVTNGLVDAQSNNELFTVLVDMMAVLIFGTLVTEGMEKEENKRTYLNLTKKLKRELGDRGNDSIDKIRQLMPLPKRYYEGLQIAKMEKMSPWEVIEGFKNPPPVSWTFFSAGKLEKKPLKNEEQHRLLMYHTHSLRQNASYYLDPPTLPPEDLEPPPEKVEEKPKETLDVNSIQETSRRYNKKKKRNTRTGSGSSNSYLQTPMNRLPYQDPLYQPGPPANWYGPPPQPQPYYPQSQITQASPGPRFGAQQLTPKQAIHNMLHTRHRAPGNYMPSNSPSMQNIQMIQKQEQQRLIRQQLRSQFSRPSQMTGNQNMYSNQMQPGQMHPMNPPPPGMSPNYPSSYNIPQQQTGGMMDSVPGSGMMTQNYNQSYQGGSQNPNMLQSVGGQQSYVSQGQQQSHPHFNPQTRMQPSIPNPNSTMGNMSQPISNYSQMPPQQQAQQAQQPGGNYNMQRMTTQQQQQLQLQQQRRLVMKQQQMLQQQQQQQQQQQTSQQQQTAALVAQLQRQMSGAPMQQQYNTNSYLCITSNTTILYLVCYSIKYKYLNLHSNTTFHICIESNIYIFIKTCLHTASNKISSKFIDYVNIFSVQEMSAYPTQENRPLKKPKLGPPDVYPQDPKQKEDELTAASVKHGFNNNPTFGDEYGSARRENIKQDKFGSEFIAIMAKKREFNTFQDTSKKKQQPTKDNFWPAAKNKNAMEAWFKDLAGNKPLSQLAKKVPTFNKKEEIFSTLCEFSVPMVKAAWFIKMTASYNVAMQENKTKKRQTVDQSVDWALSLTKFLKDQILKIQEPYSGGPGGPTSGFLTVSSSNPTLQVDLDQALKQWHYSCKLARHMYDEGLLDRQEYLNWLIDLLEKMKHMEDTTLKLIMAQVLDKLMQFCSDCGYVSPRTQSPMLASNGNGMTSAAENNQMMSQNPLTAIFEQYNRCPQHRGIILSLSATLQVITLLCPTGLVWNSLGDGKSTSFLFGSPLDLLPCAPSNLPMPLGPHNDQIRAQIRASEHQLKLRGRAAEVRWSSDKCQQSTRGFTISKMLDVLDMLDRHNFDKVESNNSIDTLYSKIFSINQNKDGNEPLVSDEPIIHLLIDWAVSMYRCGNYRAVVVAKLLEKRQNELRNEKFGDTDVSEDKDSVGSDMMVSPGVPIFQNLLLHFLDERAPVLDENLPEDNRQGFANLIQLFSELIRHDVFSHDAYMCTLISRGDLMSSPAVMSLSADSIDLYSVKSQDESIKHEHQDDIKVDIDMHTMESDLTSLFASVKSVKSEKDVPVPSVSGMAEQNISQQNKGPSRHMLFAQHFPIPQDDISVHECNQRMIVLYGVGKARDDARHISKKITKDTLKLFSKKNCIDTSSGDLGKMKKKKEKDSGDSSMSSTNTNFELVFDGIFNKFQKLSFYDQHAVTAQCASTVLEQIHSFTSNSSSYLPLVENISYLFDLMEYSYNIYGLLEFSVQLLKELSLVEQQLNSQDSSLAGRYTTSLCLCIVGVFRKYHSYLLVCPDLTVQAFEGLIGVVKHVCNPADCSSAERCILAYLYDAYTSCSYLRSKFSEMFSNAYTKMKMTLYATITPSASNLLSQLDNVLIKQLNDNPANRYSFVCNAMLNICNSQETDRLNEISVLCAELTARCNSLSSEWLGVLQALCCSSNHSCGFIDVLTQIDVSDMSIHDSLAVFTAILIARHCFSLQDLVVHVVLPSLLAARPTASGDTDAEPGARLTCHILLRLFKTSDMSLMSAQNGKSTCNIKASCDRHLLAAAHDSITVGPVLAVLKAMLVLKDDEDMDMITSKGKGGIESAGLSEFAKHALKEMCRQEWVQEKFLKDPDGVLSSDLLLDPMLTNKQMICYPNGVPNQVEGCDPDNKQVIYRVLQTLNQWGLRVSLLELQLMFKQATSQTETNSILDNIARGAIELFQQQTDGGRSNNDMDSQQGGRNDSDGDAIWMIGPLISKLPSQVQGRVLKLAGSKLEGGNNFLSSKGGKFDKDRGKRSKSLLSQQPFLSLVLNCLKGQDEQREGLLSSLLSQLEKFINNCKEALDKTPDESKVRQNIHEALLLRLSLVGGMFDTIQRNTSNTIDWALLLVQLVTNGLVDAQSNNELFTVLVDMMAVLIFGTLVTEGMEKEENKRTYLNLTKKLKRELGDRGNDSIDKIRQLMPLPKRYYEVICTERHGTQGLQIAKMEKMSPWEVIEGFKNPPPVSWTFFSAGKLEKKPLKNEEQHRLLMYHTHSLRQNASYYLDPPTLPPEDLEPPPEKVEEKPKETLDVNSIQETSRRYNKKKKRNTRTGSGSSNSYLQTPMNRLPYQDPLYQPGPPANWYGPPPQPQPYYPQSQITQASPGPRFGAQQLTPKQAIHNMLHTRHRAPGNYMPSNSPSMQNIQMIQKQEQQRLIRQQLRSQFSRPSQMTGNQNMYSNQMQPGQMHPMNPPPPGMSPNYPSSYNIPQQQTGGMMDSVPGSGMMTQNYNQSYQGGSQNPNMLQSVGGQQSYVSQGQQQSHPHFNPQTRMQPSIPNPNSTMGNMSQPISNYSQMPPQQQAQQAQQPGGNYNMQRMTTQQQQQLQLQQQRRLVMKQQQMLQQQQQQQQQQQTSQQQQTAALVAQLQRQMSGAPMQQQYNTHPNIKFQHTSSYNTLYLLTTIFTFYLFLYEKVIFVTFLTTFCLSEKKKKTRTFFTI
ncbi:hypothetical protein KUTeg_012081 [Tegillarca granosa]|uniref:Mediator complex subunit Med12 domain-containing protein n=1 Tax=Tegillarca granosa TaxID=220873 RepID=A0ABQ9F0X2_TEGGR|nr:hypothetical protein KUTeg_012081 [Tegillarca granosa]